MSEPAPSPSPVRDVVVVQVIAIRALHGAGVPSDPMRIITEYWSLDGKKLAEEKAQPDAAAASFP